MKTHVYFGNGHLTKYSPTHLVERIILYRKSVTTTQAPASAAMPILPLLRTAAFDPEATETLGSAFDAAWNVLLRSRSNLATDDNAMVTREVLAKCIIAMGRTGERDRRRLVNDAPARVVNSRLISREGWPAAGEW